MFWWTELDFRKPSRILTKKNLLLCIWTCSILSWCIYNTLNCYKSIGCLQQLSCIRILYACIVGPKACRERERGKSDLTNATTCICLVNWLFIYSLHDTDYIGVPGSISSNWPISWLTHSTTHSNWNSITIGFSLISNEISFSHCQ